MAAYFGGWVDTTIRSICNILTPIPVLLIQVVAAGSLDKRDVTIYTMAFIVAWSGCELGVGERVARSRRRYFLPTTS